VSIQFNYCLDPITTSELEFSAPIDKEYAELAMPTPHPPYWLDARGEAAVFFGEHTPLEGRNVRSHSQLVKEHRLDIERPFHDETSREAGLLDQPAEQIEIGIRRHHHVQTAIGFQALASLFE
jgi:hypothetical protein